MRTYTRKPVIDRLLARCYVNGDCWIWAGALVTNGYGTINDGNGRMLPTHRVTYEHFIGPIPDGLQIDHLCRVRTCCNPWHMEPVTPKVNVNRGDSPKRMSSRTHCPRGHIYDQANTYVTRQGHRQCRACKPILRALQSARKQEVA